MTTKGITQAKHLKPKISIYEALSLRVSPRETLSTCSLDEIIDLIEIAIECAPQPEKIRQALVNVDLSDITSRWYVVETLLQHKAPIPNL